MSSSDKKKIIILIAVFVVLVATGIALNFWQKQMPQEPENINKESNKLTEEQIEKLQKAEQAIKDDPSNNVAWVELGNLQKGLKLFDKSIYSYNQALTLQPGDALALNNLANLYSDLKEYEKAEEYLLKLIEANYKWIQAYTDLADIYRFNLPEKRDKIPEILEMGYEKNPDKQAVFLRYLAVYHKDFGDKEKAIKNYQELLKLEPENKTAKLELEQLLIE